MKNFLIMLLVISNILFGLEYLHSLRELDAVLLRCSELSKENEELLVKYHELREMYNMQVAPDENLLSNMSYNVAIYNEGRNFYEVC